MYLDKDSRGEYSLHDISIEELNILRTLFSTYHNSHYKELETISFEISSIIDLQLLKLESDDRLEHTPNGKPGLD